ncbi:LuxE/PaaK family acyltransferase [Xylanibacter oryzae]|uniref:LuxE/PaaK family acyltransferase n=1 Tax=Xylanibacter oryzae TaxID=185293 RepID=UPI0004AEDC8C|nr:hypothetical protein [Xylanibacter oryzae]
MDHIKKLFNIKDPYLYDDKLFVQAMRENVCWHYNQNKDYRRILDSFSFKPNDIKKITDLENIPFIPTLYFKHHYLLSGKKRIIQINATSSGTSGRNKSMISFDFYTLKRLFRMVIRLFKYHKILSFRFQRFVIFGYEHTFRNNKAVAKSAWAFTFTSPAKSKDYAIRYVDGEYKVDLPNIERKLVKYAKGSTPVRTLGFPAYTYFLLEQMDEHGINVKLPKGSLMTLGGGWKQFTAEKVSKEDFYKLAKKVLGLDSESIIEFFGAVEHPIMWTQCECHHFHVPAYARVIIRDADTLVPLPHGQKGLINLLTPASKSCPLSSIMTDDIGIIHDEECPCGIKTPYLEILGRVGIDDIKTCAEGATELLKSDKK